MPRLAKFLLALLCGLACAVARAGEDFDAAQQDFLKGRYDAVIATAKQKIASRDYDGDWRGLLVKSLLTVGRYGEAHTAAMAGVSDYSDALEHRLLARETFLFQNDEAGAARQLEEIKLMAQQRFRRFQSDEPAALGRALLLLGLEPRLVLENCFRRAENASPPDREAFLAAGGLALDKHDFALAADTFRAGLKKFPDDPDMECGVARSFESGDREPMLQAIAAALAVNPRHIPTLLLLAGHMIDSEAYDDAAKQLDAVLKVNPHRPQALAYRAVLAHLRNDIAAEQKARAAALECWKTNPQVDYLIGLKLAQKYRFAEGAAAQRRALDFDPAYLPARRELAQDLLRLGQTDEGWKLAEQVREKDDYDVEAHNLIALRDKLAKFATLTNADFVVQMATNEAPLYGAAVLDLLERARTTLCQKYGVRLDSQTTVDIFPDEKDFGVRTFGMPENPGYLGVCFGSVITANSPASQAPNPANWKDVLWHEFCHVVTLTATRNRMPRWLSEGISVYEERQANPAWGERMNLAYRNMIEKDELTPLGKLSGAFLTPKNGEHLQFAYYESSLAVEYIVGKYGFDSLTAILRDLGDGREIYAAIAAHTCALPELEKGFAAFARQKAEALGPDAGDVHLTMDKARDLMDAGRWADALPLLESAVGPCRGEHGAHQPLWLMAQAQGRLGDTNAELATLRKFATNETDFVELDLRLIEISEARHDWRGEIDAAEDLLAVNPLIAVPYAALAQGGAAAGQNELAIDGCRKLLLLDPPDAAQTHFQLARLLRGRGGAEGEARRNALEALEEAPRFRPAQRLLLEIDHEHTD